MQFLRRLLTGLGRFGREAIRLLVLLFSPRSVTIVGYSKRHPIYSDYFAAARIDGVRFHCTTSYSSLRWLDRLVRRRVRLIHRDAASPRQEWWPTTCVIECEGRPSADILSDDSALAVFVQSKAAGAELLRDGRVQLLRPACPLPRLRQRRKADGSPVTILAVGHGGMLKGYDALAMAWNELADRYPVRLVVAGTTGHDFATYPEISRGAYAAADFPSLAARFRTDSRVAFGAQLREVLLRRTYWEADIYVHLARMETFGYSILEAMAHALPVVATNVRAIPEMVLHGETGYLVDVKGIDINSPSWPEHVSRNVVEYVSSLIENPDLRERMGVAGRRRVSEAFSVQYRDDVLKRVYAGLQGDRSVMQPNLPTVR